MAAIMKISPQGQIRIPKKIMARLGIDKGDYVEVDVKAKKIVLNRHGRIQNILATHGYENTDWFFNMVLCVFMLKPRKLIDPFQGWYWTKEWQKMEARADEDIEKDQLSPKFETAEDGLKWLQK